MPVASAQQRRLLRRLHDHHRQQRDDHEDHERTRIAKQQLGLMAGDDQ